MPGLRFLLVLLLAYAGAVAAAPEELRPFHATYSITWNGMSAGTSELELTHLADGRWSFQSRNSARGLFRLAMPAETSSHSIFSVQNGHIVPQQFATDDGASSSEKDQKLEFDWVRGRVTGVAERKPVDLPTQQGLLDVMSVEVALMQELLAGRTPQRLAYVDKGKIKDYLYRAEGNATLRTEAGEHRTVIFSRSKPGSKKSTWFWCAPELGYLPLRIERRDGKDVEMTMAVKTLTVDGG